MKRKAKRTIPGKSNEVDGLGKLPTRIHDGLGTTMPPNLEGLHIYFDQKGVPDLADEFFHEYDIRDWKTPTGGTVRNWKVCAAEWIYNYQQEAKRKFRQSPFYSES
jgi:hypothetical protein